LAISFSGKFNNQSASGFFLSDNEFDPASLSVEKKVEAFKRRNEPKKENPKKELKLQAGKRKMYATQVCVFPSSFLFPPLLL